MAYSFEKTVRANVLALEPYSCARDEYEGGDAVFLDANENPFDTGYNRYPDPHQRELKRVVSHIKGVAAENIMLGNGSDEIIDILIRSVCRPGQDNIIVSSPGYSMYGVSAHVNDVQVRQVCLTEDFLPDWEKIRAVADESTKIVFVVTPNNPVGTVAPLADIEDFCSSFDGIVLVDEAYIDFTDAPSTVTVLEKHPNMAVLQTMSKSWGMAGLRIGMCFAHKDIISVFDKVKAPYNMSSLTQAAALEVLSDQASYRRKLEEIKRERERLYEVFVSSGCFEAVYPSQANFLLVRTPYFRQLYAFLVENGVVVRLRDIPPLIPSGVRITVGTKEQNDALLRLLDEFFTAIGRSMVVSVPPGSPGRYYRKFKKPLRTHEGVFSCRQYRRLHL